MGQSHSLGRKRKHKPVTGNVNTPASNFGVGVDKTALVTTETYGTKYWKTVTTEVRDSETGTILNTEVELHIRDQSLRRWLQTYSVNLFFPPQTEEERQAKKKPPKPIVAIEQLFFALPKLKNCKDVPAVDALVLYLEEEMPKYVEKAENFLKEGLLTFDCCWYLFKVGKTVAVELPALNGVPVGTRVTSLSYNRGIVPYWEMSGKVIKSDGREFYEHSIHFSVTYFPTPSLLENLAVKPLDQNMTDRLAERGRKFRDIALSNRFMQYDGFFMKTTGFGPSKFKVSGRVMVDVTTHNRLHPSDRTFVNPAPRTNNWNNDGNGPTQLDCNLNTTIPDEQLFTTWPTLVGFSFQRKRWGELQVDNLDEIKFDERAFDKLVMKPKTKNLVRELVRNNSNQEGFHFNDFISEKGGGCIFLLHGPPGTGKTLTAEAVSELLHTPLYSVSMGELGTTTQELESNLQQILEVAAIWGASILLDEADIFLEKRNQHDIVRNAMVGIFLRLLEYHQGVLFLTTNRLKTFDPAFQSRVSIAVKYNRLCLDSRRQIWTQFLEEAGLPLETQAIERLAGFKMNGRQIRNTLRLASIVASEEGVELQPRHLEEMLILSKKWFKDFTQRQSATQDEASDLIDLSTARKIVHDKAQDIYHSDDEDSSDEEA